MGIEYIFQTKSWASPHDFVWTFGNRVGLESGVLFSILDFQLSSDLGGLV
jgi:hypothetical protein